MRRSDRQRNYHTAVQSIQALAFDHNQIADVRFRSWLRTRACSTPRQRLLERRQQHIRPGAQDSRANTLWLGTTEYRRRFIRDFDDPDWLRVSDRPRHRNCRRPDAVILNVVPQLGQTCASGTRMTVQTMIGIFCSYEITHGGFERAAGRAVRNKCCDAPPSPLTSMSDVTAVAARSPQPVVVVSRERRRQPKGAPKKSIAAASP